MPPIQLLSKSSRGEFTRMPVRRLNCRTMGTRMPPDGGRRERPAADFAAIGLEILESLDPITYEHCIAMGGLFAHLIEIALARHRAAFDLGDARQLSLMKFQTIAIIGAMHDIGKRRILPGIIEKAGPLDARERSIIETHAEIGALENVTIFTKDGMGLVHGPQLRLAKEIARGHHARPEDPLSRSAVVRIAAIADVSDAMAQRRSYKSAMEPERVRAELGKLRSAGKLDPDLLDMTYENWESVAALLRLRNKKNILSRSDALEFLAAAEEATLARIMDAAARQNIDGRMADKVMDRLLTLYFVKYRGTVK